MAQGWFAKSARQMVRIQLFLGQGPISCCDIDRKGERESAQAHRPRETHNQLGEKPPQRLAQEKDRTHIRDATPMGYEPKDLLTP